MEKAARLSSNEDEEGAVAYRRLSMRRIREILRLKFEAGLSQRAIARAIGVSNSTVSEAFSRLGEAGLSWPLPEGLGDAELEARLYRARGRAVADPREPDWAGVQKKLSGKYVTLRLAWEEYGAVHAGGYGYSWFCERYRAWQERIDVVMRQEHKAGEKLFVDSRRQEAPLHRRREREGAPGFPLPGRARGQQLHLRRGLRERAHGELPHGSRARLRVLRGRPRVACA